MEQNNSSLGNVSNTPPITPVTPPSKPSRSHHPVVIAIVILAVVILGGAYAYGKSIGMFNSPKTVVKNAFLGSKNTTSVHSEINIPIEYTMNSQTENMEASIISNVEKKGEENANVDSKITFHGQGLVAEAEVKYINDVLYVRVNEFPLMSLISRDTQILKKWFSISKAELETLAKDTGRVETEKVKLTAEEVYGILDKQGIFDEVVSGGTSSKKGTFVRTYMINLDKQKVIKTLLAVVEKYASTTPEVSKVNPQDLEKEWTKLLETVTFEKIFLDIGIVDGRIHGFESGIRILPPKPESIDALSRGISARFPSEIKVGFNIAYSDFGKVFTFAIPTDSTPIMNYINQSKASAKQNANDASVKGNLSLLRSQAELYYDKTGGYAGFCTKDTYAISTLPMIKAQSGANPTCLDSAAAYVIAAPLSTGQYFCVDSTGLATTITGKPVVRSCK